MGNSLNYFLMKFFLFFILVIIGPIAISQENRPVRFGIKAGANFSHINFSKGSLPPETPIPTNWQPGIVTGVVVIIPLRQNFYFQPEYLFSQMGGKIKNEDRQFAINYASLPVLLRWEFLNKFSGQVGPQFDLLINAKEKSGNNESSMDDDIEHRSIFFNFGLEYSFTSNLGMSINYLHGLNHVDIVRENGNQEYKYEVIQFSLLYLF